MKTIIVPMDFSSEALYGLNWSIFLAQKTNAQVLMVHVIKKNEISDLDLIEKDKELAEIKFKELVQTIREKHQSNSELKYVIKIGKIFKEVNELADSFEDVLTILTTHGESGFEELFIGGNAYKITSHSKNPVISVRRSKVPNNINRIVLPLDITFQTREKVPYTAHLAKLFHSEIHLITVQQSNLTSIESKLHLYVEQVASYLGKQNIPFHTHQLQGENLTDIILDYAVSVNADLISIMTEQEKSVSNLLLGSYAHQMINKSFIPVLLFPNYQIRIVSEDIWDLGAFNPRN